MVPINKDERRKKMQLMSFIHLMLLSVVWGLTLTISKYQLVIKHDNEDDIKLTKAETFTILLQAWGIWTVKISLSILAVIGLGILVASI